MSIQKNIAAKIQFAMMRENLTMEEFAQELGIARSSLQEYLRENTNLRVDTVELLAKKLGYSPAELISDISACQLQDLRNPYQLHPMLRPLAEALHIEIMHMSEALYQLDRQSERTVEEPQK